MNFSGRFAGYAALFDIPDAAHDTVTPGAFRRTLAERRDPIPLFWQHKPDQQIGRADLVTEDKRGLRVIARIDNPQGRVGRMLARRAIHGLSFGYRARAYRLTQTGRLLDDIDLFEISLVSHPLQHGARVHLII